MLHTYVRTYIYMYVYNWCRWLVMWLLMNYRWTLSASECICLGRNAPRIGHMVNQMITGAGGFLGRTRRKLHLSPAVERALHQSRQWGLDTEDQPSGIDNSYEPFVQETVSQEPRVQMLCLRQSFLRVGCLSDICDATLSAVHQEPCSR